MRAIRGGQDALDLQRGATEAFGMTGKDEEHDPARRPRRRLREDRRFSLARTAADRPTTIPGGARSTNTANKQQHRDGIEEPLQDDGRKSRGRREMLAARQKVGPEHFSGAGRQQEAGGEADDRGFETRSEKCVGPIGASRYCHR